jgi:cytidine deaminase
MTEDDLLAAARAARPMAHAPYSRFFVGAAILADDGRIYSGCNVENASYPEGVCAEGGALSAMVLGGGRKAVMIALSAGPEGHVQPCLPCGGCRQRILEFATPQTVVITDTASGAHQRHAFSDLMPQAFGPEDLKRS